MTSTHSANPLCCVAALASLETIIEDDLVGNSRSVGELLHARLRYWAEDRPEVARVFGMGLVAGVVIVDAESQEPNGALAFDIARRCVEKGVLLFSPVGFGGATIKICPPLNITAEAVEESLEAFDEAFVEAVEAPAAALQAV